MQPFDNQAVKCDRQKGEFFQNNIYPLQDRVLQCIRQLDLPFYLTGETAFNRFTLSGRYTRNLHYQVHNETNFTSFLQQARSAIIAEFAGLIQTEVTEASGYSTEICVSAGVCLRLSFRHYSGYHVDSIRPGGVIVDPRYGRLDYWQNICADILAREANHGVGDAVDLWWMANNYELNWQDMVGLARKKNAKTDIGRIEQNIQAVTLSDINEIPWIINKNPATVLSGLKILNENLMHGRENSLAPKPVDEH